jgi:hypothetical protein
VESVSDAARARAGDGAATGGRWQLLLQVAKMTLKPWTLLVGFAAVSSPAGAQPDSLALSIPTSGARIRVVNTVLKKSQWNGRLVRWVGDTVVVTSGRAREQVLLLERWHRLDVSTGRHRHVVRNGLIGAGALALVGAGIGASVVNPKASQSSACVPLGPEGACWGITRGGTPREAGAAVGGAFGAVVGGLIGMATGLVRHETWRPVAQPIEPKVALSVGPIAGRVGVQGRLLIGRARSGLP